MHQRHVPPDCLLVFVLRAKIRKRLTGAKGKESDVERQICGDMNGLQVFFCPVLDRVRDLEP